MSVFGHGQLRLYVLALLREGPRHGYDIIRELENRFSGMYAPSAGTVYPRLAKLEEEGLVERTDEGRKTLYGLTDAGRAEAESRAEEIADLESSIDASADRMAEEVRRRVREGAADLRNQVAAATAGLRKDVPPRASVWGAATDGSTPPPFDLDALLGGLTRGHLPDADSVAGAMRRWGFGTTAETARQETTGEAAASGSATPGEAAGPGASSAPGVSATPDGSAVTADSAQRTGDAAAPHVPDAREVTADEVLGEVVEDGVRDMDDTETDPGRPRTSAQDDAGTRVHGSGFPSSEQVREVIAILKDAGERIQQVLDQPRR